MLMTAPGAAAPQGTAHRSQETGMVDDEVWRIQEFRDIALRLRMLARRARSPDARRQLLDLADRFDRVAGELRGEDPPA